MKIRKSNEYPILYWMITFLIICVSQDTLLFGTNGNSIYTTIAKVIPFVVIGLIVVSRNVFLWNKKKFTMVSVICMLPVISCVANGENINNYVYRFAIMLAGAFVVMFMEMRMFYELFRRIIDFLSIWSIGTFMLSYLVPGLVKMMPIIRNSRGFGYYNMIFSVVSFDGSLRNHSIFREPGMFMVMLVIATFIEILIAEKINMKRIFLYSIAILTTISTAGYIILALVYIYIILMDDRVKSRYQMLLI